MTGLIPANTKAAAKRGFIRTASQSIAGALGAGISATAILAVVAGEVALVPTLITWGVAVATPFINGAQSYFDILSKGIPEDYEALDG
jgi:hypothetical protein